jgi:hypothetical protein
LSSKGVQPNHSKTKIVEDFPVPKTAKHVKSFLGLASYYKKFIRQFSQISEPLRRLLHKDVKFEWSPDCQAAFEKLKLALVTALVLALPNFQRGGFTLTSDASTTGLAYILSQKDDQGLNRL